ncbi:MAG TPA: threonine dehydratase [Accumulibacter sp.]|mgnify:CR=1 FL=1|jgi:threonine dehydratase|nr:threonine dehydratase [Accumulibacter sp.]HQC80682.1 threonine dehydratase [Accumulibacter sp.]
MLPTLDEITDAATIIYRAMPPTPQYCWPLLCERLGAEVWVKHENHTPVGAFKLRGGLVYFADLARRTGLKGVVTATRGNHGQSVAMAAKRHGLSATVVVPHGNSLEKNAAMRALGAELVEYGNDFQASREQAARIAEEHSLHLVPAFHPSLLRGVATYSMELLQAVRDLDTVYVPIGLGSGICGLVAARNALGHRAEIVGVVSSQARAYAASFAAKAVVEAEVSTSLADGMACRTPVPEALEIIWRHVDRIVEVSDDEIAAAIRVLHECTHNCAEGAGAAGLAAAIKERRAVTGRKVAFVLSGGNIDRQTFAQVLCETSTA